MRTKELLVVAAFLAAPACEDVSGGGDDSANSASASNGSSASGTDGVGTSPSAAEGGGETPPSQGEVDRCRQACDSLLNFDCIDVDTHELCWSACPQRSEEEIELFVACERNADFCEEGCLENFLDADPVDPTGEGGEESGPSESVGGGGPLFDCVGACNAYVGMGCSLDIGETGSCQALCDSLPESLHDFAVMCLEDAEDCVLPEDCTFSEGGE